MHTWSMLNIHTEEQDEAACMFKNEKMLWDDPFGAQLLAEC